MFSAYSMIGNLMFCLLFTVITMVFLIHLVKYFTLFVSGEENIFPRIDLDKTFCFSKFGMLKLMNPFDLVMTYLILLLAAMITSITWVISYPLLVILLIGTFVRKKNIHKKKMWQELQK